MRRRPPPRTTGTDPLPAALAPLLAAAAAAPSVLNTQPWRFVVDEPDRIEVWADRSRTLPHADPTGRELLISCGAAVANLELAAGAGGHRPTVAALPDGGHGDRVAAVVLGQGPPPSPVDHELADAVLRRRTVRRPFLNRPVNEGALDAMGSAGDRWGAELHVLGPTQRELVAALVGEADRLLFRNRAWRRELAGWLQPPWKDQGLAVPAGTVVLSRLLVAGFDVGRRTGRNDADLARHVPVLAVVATAGDEPADWVTAGRALQAMLLAAVTYGVQAGFANQPCQVPALRAELRSLLGGAGHPQVVLRLGYPPSGAGAAGRRPRRRPLTDVVTTSSPVGGQVADGRP